MKPGVKMRDGIHRYSSYSSRFPFVLRILCMLLVMLAANNAFALLDLRNASVSHLDNGLTVIVLPDANFPLVSAHMLYRSGARDEVSGKTGLAHFLEHMAFRDSKNYPDGALVDAIYAVGGEWHGYTWTDATNYFATAPKEHLDLLLRIEADRMSQLSLSPDDMEAERGAVLAELHMYETDPDSILLDAIMITSFLAHPYRNNTIGWESDVANLEYADIVSFYRDNYHPANAVLVVVGDMEKEQTLARIKELFGGIPARKTKTGVLTPEPVQIGERRIHLQRSGNARQFKIGYRAPSSRHPDFAAFLVLQELLGAGSGVNFLQNDWGTPVHEHGLLAGAADDLSTWYPPSADDFLFVITGSAPAAESEADVEAKIEARVSTARDKLILPSRLETAIKRTLDELVFDVETTEDAAHQLAFFEGMHALDMLFALPDQVRAVTVEDVQRVAQTWLPAERRTIAWYLPGSMTSNQETTRPEVVPARKRVAGQTRTIDREALPLPIVRKLGGGIPVILQVADLSSTMHLQIVIPGNHYEANDYLQDAPVSGYSSIGFNRRAHGLAATVEDASKVMQQVRNSKILRPPVSDNAETRLEQTFEEYINVENKKQANDITPVLIVVSGDIDIEETYAALEQAFGTLPAWSATTAKRPPVKKGEVKIELGSAVAQAQLGYVVSAPGPEEQGYDANRFLQYIFAHDYSGRLGSEAISKRGLAYYIDSRYRTDGNNGWVTLGIGVDGPKIDALQGVMKNELQRLQREAPSVAEVEEARSHFLGRARSAAQSNAELATELARQWLWHGKLLSEEMLRRRLSAVSHDDVVKGVPAFIKGLIIVVDE